MSVITKIDYACAWVLRLPDKKQSETHWIGDLENTWLHNVGYFSSRYVRPSIFLHLFVDVRIVVHSEKKPLKTHMFL